MPRPTSVFVLAILNLIWGGLTTVGFLCFGAATAAAPYLLSFSGPPGATPPRMDPVFLWYALAGIALAFGLSLVTFICGLGMLRMRPWARTWCLAAAAVNLVTTVADVALQRTVMLPYSQEYTAAIQSWQGATPTASPANVQAGTDLGITMGTVSGYAGSAFFILFSLVQLAILLRPSVRAAFERQERWAGRASKSEASSVPQERLRLVLEQSKELQKRQAAEETARLSKEQYSEVVSIG
jgi:hypothetical protein